MLEILLSIISHSIALCNLSDFSLSLYLNAIYNWKRMTMMMGFITYPDTSQRMSVSVCVWPYCKVRGPRQKGRRARVEKIKIWILIPCHVIQCIRRFLALNTCAFSIVSSDSFNLWALPPQLFVCSLCVSTLATAIAGVSLGLNLRLKTGSPHCCFVKTK